MKRIAESIIIDKVTLNNVEFYLGTIDENINGLLGLDVLIKSKSIINLNKMEIEIKYN
ncbi:hypothetical protein [Clostridium sp. DMHC 10]|uniref:hypothetical protein n=1 Tax=Clostridium sp. DMHC 10 TaxID=747377 RepID=UPI000AE72634|nr:hypothetical protein [Clostridium sp. DMHC 10]